MSHHICPACVALATASHARSPGQVAVAVPRAYLWLGGPVARNGFGIPGFLSSIASYAILPSSSPPLSLCMVSHSGNRREIACRLHFSASWEADVRQFLQTQEPDLAAAGLDLQEIHKSDLFSFLCVKPALVILTCCRPGHWGCRRRTLNNSLNESSKVRCLCNT